MKLTEHFTLEEMLHSDTAEKKKRENRINAAEVDNLVRLCQKVLEPLRAHFGVPIKINSGFRCQALNKAVGGATNSYHTKGRAVDIPMHPGWLAYIRDHLPHTELINKGTWIHVPSLISSVCGRWSRMYANQPGLIGMSTALPFVW